jgi:hypothetical protein
MAVIAITALDLKPGRWDDAQGVIKTGNGLIKKHGGENVTTMVAMLAGPASGRVSTLWTTPDWESFGKVFNALMADSMGPDGPSVSFDTYVNQAIPDL